MISSNYDFLFHNAYNYADSDSIMETITLIVIGIVAAFGAFIMVPGDEQPLNATIPSPVEGPAPIIPVKDNHRPVFGEQMAKPNAPVVIEVQNISAASAQIGFIQSLNVSRQELLEMIDYEFMYQGLGPIKTIGITFEDEFDARDVLTLEDGHITSVTEDSIEPAEYEMSFTRQGIQTCLDMRKSFSAGVLSECMRGMHTNQTDVFNGIIKRGCIANFGTDFICQPFMR